MEKIKSWKCFGGEQQVFAHDSKTLGTKAEFAVFVPPQAADGRCPVLWYLSGLTCTWENATTKAGFQRLAAEYGWFVIAPDTSPRGANVDGEDEGWDFGTGAGFYVDATAAPFASNYNMYSYVTEELQQLVGDMAGTDMNKQGITGHSMGGHGALVLGLRRPDLYGSVSAFAPIVHPSVVPWGQKAFRGYLGEDESTWAEWDATELVKSKARKDTILIDQGGADSFLERELKPELFEAACKQAGQPLELHIRDGYDHSYYFISSFIEGHFAHHAGILLS